MHLLIAAAGSGRRMGADRNKLLLPLAGKPVIAWTMKAALSAERISWIGIVGQESDRSEILAAGRHLGHGQRSKSLRKR